MSDERYTSTPKQPKHGAPPRIHILWWRIAALLTFLAIITLATTGAMAYTRQHAELQDLRKEVVELQKRLDSETTGAPPVE